MTEEIMTIRQMCESYGVTPRTLRFYESKELIFPVREGQKRLYNRSDRARLKLIMRGKRFGFSLEEIRQLLDMYNLDDQGATQLAKTYEIAKERLSAMIQQHDELGDAIQDLTKQLKWAEKMLASMNTNAAPQHAMAG